MPTTWFAFTFTILLSLFCACKKEDLSNAGGQRLQKIISSSGDSILVTSFSYDVHGRLTSIIDSNNNGHVWETFIDYNDQGKPVKFKVIYSSSANNFGTESFGSLLYNNNNEVVEKMFSSTFNGPYKKIHSYAYDAGGRLVGDTTYGHWSDEVYSYTTFTYDANSNVAQWEQYSKSSGTMQSDGITTASYNTMNNPYVNLGSAAYFIREENVLLNRHNRVLTNYYDGTTGSYTYEYYNNGLIKKIVAYYDDAGTRSLEGIREFFYD